MFPIDILGNPCAISMADKLRLSSFTSNEKGSSVLARPGSPGRGWYCSYITSKFVKGSEEIGSGRSQLRKKTSEMRN